MKCHLCNKPIDKKEDYKTHIIRKAFSTKRIRLHRKCWEMHLGKFQ